MTAEQTALGKPYAVRAAESMGRALEYVTDGAGLAHALWWFLQARTWSALERRDFAERDVVVVIQRDLERAMDKANPDPAWHLAIHTADALSAHGH